MGPRVSAFFRGSLPRLPGIAAVVAVSFLLAACASSDGSGGFGGMFGGAKPSADPTGSAANKGVITVKTAEQDPNFFLKAGYCPPVQILPGTESMVVYEKGHDGDAASIRSQGSITRTARECHVLDASTLSIKIGVAGRILAGPKGAAGTVTLPLRIAVTRQHDNSVLFSKQFSVGASLAEPELAADYSAVFDQVEFKVGPDDRDLIVYVGFDEGKPKTGT